MDGAVGEVDGSTLLARAVSVGGVIVPHSSRDAIAPIGTENFNLGRMVRLIGLAKRTLRSLVVCLGSAPPTLGTGVVILPSVTLGPSALSGCGVWAVVGCCGKGRRCAVGVSLGCCFGAVPRVLARACNSNLVCDPSGGKR